MALTVSHNNFTSCVCDTDDEKEENSHSESKESVLTTSLLLLPVSQEKELSWGMGTHLVKGRKDTALYSPENPSQKACVLNTVAELTYFLSS